jgi:hypothetical protein
MGSQSDRSSDKMPAGAVAKLILRLLICTVAVFVVTAVLNTVSLRDRPLFPLLIFLFLVSIVSSLWGFRYALFVLQPWDLVGCARRSAVFGSVIGVISLRSPHSSSSGSLPAIFQTVPAERL